MAVEAGADQPWLADAAAELAEQTGASVDVVSVDGVEAEMLSTLPRTETIRLARDSAQGVADRLSAAGVPAEAHAVSGRVVPGILLFAEESDADLIVVGGSTRGRVARRLLGTSSLELVSRSRRPVLVITPPGS